MSVIDDDSKFEKLLEDKRHKELAGSLKTIASLLSNKDDNGVSEAISIQTKKIEALVESIKLMPTPQIPEVNIELNPKDFVFSVREICADIVSSNNKVIEALENRLLPDTFDLVKYNGFTNSVKVNYKTAKEIFNTKK